jgi:hypothetical protein
MGCGMRGRSRLQVSGCDGVLQRQRDDFGQVGLGRLGRTAPQDLGNLATKGLGKRADARRGRAALDHGHQSLAYDLV